MNEEDFISSQEELLKGIEAEMLAEIAPTLEFTLNRLERLPDDATDQDYEQVLSALNDGLLSTIGSVMFLQQDAVVNLALQLGDGQRPPMRSPAELVEATIQGETIASQLQRRSPSKWMRNLFGQGRKAVEAQVEAIIAGAVWSIAGKLTIEAIPTAEQWKWVTERDEKVCSICSPLDGLLLERSELGVYPAHMKCRCGIVPVQAG